MPAGEARPGEFEGEGGQGVQTDVDDRLAGPGDAVEPLLADTIRRHQQPFFPKRVLAADFRQRVGELIH